MLYAMKIFFRSTALSCLFLFLTAAEGRAQAPVTDGLWELSQGGSVVGHESFSLSPLPEGGMKLQTRLELTGKGESGKAESVLTVNAEGFPLEYTVELSSKDVQAQAIACRFEDEGVFLLVDFGGPDSEPVDQSLRFSRRPRMVDNNTYSHYKYLADWKNLESVKRAEFEVFIPQSFFHTTASVEYRGVRSVLWKERSVNLHMGYLYLGRNLGIFVFYDAEGEPVRVDIPSQEASGARLDREPAPVAFAGGQAPSLAIDMRQKRPLADVEVKFRSGDIELAGALTLPPPPAGATAKGAKIAPRRHPAVLLISDSGGQDRDGNSPGGAMQDSFLRYLAEGLSAAGYAVLRYDERGVGGSQGDMLKAGLGDLVTDARAALEFLRSRSDVDGTNLCVAGHGEGGLIALRLAAEGQAGLSRLVCMSVPSASLRDVLQEQTELIPEGEARELTRQAQQEIVALVEKGGDQGDYHGKTLNLKWYREHFALNPSDLARKVHVPVLLLHGTKDRQIKAEHVLYLRAALDEAGALSTLRVFPDLDHLLLPSQGGNLREYEGSQRRYGVEPLQSILDWLPEPAKP
jgi:hypothetical protein